MERRPEAQEERNARAFAPGHITGWFSPAKISPDPRGRGSLGAGIVLEAGVRANVRYRPHGRRRVSVSADIAGPLPISTEVARRLFAGKKGSLEVELRHELAVGQGFGMSAAGALATGLAVGSVLGVPRRKVVEVAHLADLFGGGGLGGVAAILGGGLEMRERPGIPPFGFVRHVPFAPSIVLTVVGSPLPSPRFLGDPEFLDRVRVAAGSPQRQMAQKLDPQTFLRASEQFTDSLGVASPKLRSLLRRLRARGSRVAQAMFGQSLWSVPPSVAARTRLLLELEANGLPSLELQASARGARLLA